MKIQTKKVNGLYCLPAGQRPGVSTGTLASCPWSVSYIHGVATRITSSLVNTADGVFDWSYFDEALALAQANSKMVSLSIAGGAFCPEWFITAGAKFITITAKLSFEDQPVTSEYILPWDVIFQANWKKLVAAFGVRYDKDPQVAYVYIGGIGAYIETFVVQNQNDYNAFNAAGGVSQWVQASKQIIDMYAAAFPTTPFMLAVGDLFNIQGDRAASEAGINALNEVVAYGVKTYPGRFGIVNQGLAATAQQTDSGYKDGLLTNNAATSPIGFQTVAAMGANLDNTLKVGLTFKPNFIEVYKRDCLEGDANELKLVNEALVVM